MIKTYSNTIDIEKLDCSFLYQYADIASNIALGKKGKVDIQVFQAGEIEIFIRENIGFYSTQELMMPEGRWAFEFPYYEEHSIEKYLSHPEGTYESLIARPSKLTLWHRAENKKNLILSVDESALIKLIGANEFDYISSHTVSRKGLDVSVALQASKCIHNAINSVENEAMFHGWVNQAFVLLMASILGGDAAKMKVSRKEQHLSHALEFIRGNYTRKVTLGDIAKYTNTSPRNLQLIFGEYLNTTPMEYLNRYRLFNFYHNLKDYKNVKEASHSSGFTHLGRASKNFKDYFLKLPSEMIEINRAERAGVTL